MSRLLSCIVFIIIIRDIVLKVRYVLIDERPRPLVAHIRYGRGARPVGALPVALFLGCKQQTDCLMVAVVTVAAVVERRGVRF